MGCIFELSFSESVAEEDETNAANEVTQPEKKPVGRSFLAQDFGWDVAPPTTSTITSGAGRRGHLERARIDDAEARRLAADGHGHSGLVDSSEGSFFFSTTRHETAQSFR